MNTKLLITLFIFPLTLFSQVTTKLKPIYTSSSDVIWGMDFHPIEKNLLFFTERSGKLKSINLATKEIKNYLGVPNVYAKNQGGLLDIVFDQKSEDVYLSYSEPLDNNKNTTSVYKGIINLKTMSLVGKRFFQAKAESNDGLHFGSRIVLDSKYIYISVGERNDRDKAQDLTVHNGKILRLTKDGAIPNDNPFVKTAMALPEIYSLGHRNPQGLTFDQNGRLFESEFGPRGGDEINLIKPGINYGWPVITYGSEYWGPKIGNTNKDGMEQPLHYWVPSISPSGIAYHMDAIYLANLSGQHVRKVVLKNDKVISEEVLFKDLEERFRHVKVGPDGFIYVSTDTGKIFRFSP